VPVNQREASKGYRAERYDDLGINDLNLASEKTRAVADLRGGWLVVGAIRAARTAEYAVGDEYLAP
jgi:hypothetical protein